LNITLALGYPSGPFEATTANAALFARSVADFILDSSTYSSILSVDPSLQVKVLVAKMRFAMLTSNELLHPPYPRFYLPVLSGAPDADNRRFRVRTTRTWGSACP
jgi:hypothetical protein